MPTKIRFIHENKPGIIEVHPTTTIIQWAGASFQMSSMQPALSKAVSAAILAKYDYDQLVNTISQLMIDEKFKEAKELFSSKLMTMGIEDVHKLRDDIHKKVDENG